MAEKLYYAFDLCFEEMKLSLETVFPFVHLNGIFFAVLIIRVVDATLTTFTEKSLSTCYDSSASISHFELYELRTR